MKTKYTIGKRLKMALWALKSPNAKYMVVEACEKCHSNSIEVGASKIQVDEKGNNVYYAKYFCRKCGASCYVQEVWENNQMLKFE